MYQSKSMESIIPVLGMFAAAAFRIMPSINRMLGSVQGMRFSLPMVDTLYNEFHQMDSVFNRSENNKIGFNNVLKINNVSFKYESADNNAVENINCSISQGSFVGFIGGSGAGKSTLVDLVLGLHTPDKGNIQVDGLDISLNLRGWQNKIGYVPQTIFLADDTLRRNVAFGLSNNEISEKQVWDALEAAQLKDFVNELQDGLDTIVGERGVRLSGGQRQRIGIARALYHNPPILILDEATSSLDTFTEKGVMEAVRSLKGMKTLIIITHRLSTVEGCDYLYRLERGKLIDEGQANLVIDGVHH